MGGEEVVSYEVTILSNLLGGSLSFLFTLVFGVVPAVFLLWRKHLRLLALKRWASERGFTYLPSGSPTIDLLHGGPLAEGRARKSLVAVRGVIDRIEAEAFDLQFVTGHGRGKRIHYYRCVAATLPFPVQPVSVERENSLERAWGVVLGDDVKLESDEFNQRFRVTTKDRRSAVDLLHPRTMEALLSQDPEAVLWSGNRVVTAEKGRWKAEQLDAAFPSVIELAQLLPPHVGEHANS